MWRKPEENKPQSALDALPSTVPSPRRPAAAAPVSSNAPWMASSKEKFILPMAFSLSVPTLASTQKSKHAKLSFAAK
jgi:hypothetical protein